MSRGVTCRRLIFFAVLGHLVLGTGSKVSATPQQLPPRVPTFRTSVDLVRVGAVVRDRKGRFVKNLSARDFVILDGDQVQKISDFQVDRPGLSIALLMDVSGSMEARMDSAREAAKYVLTGLDQIRDEAAVFTFATQLDEVQPFTLALQELPQKLSGVRPFGATSLHDAIAGTAARLTSREGLRRAVIVFTDGSDNWSRLSAAEASAAASEIDVPVYIVGIVPLIDNPSSGISAITPERTGIASTLSNLASLTGGRSFSATTPLDRSVIAQQILDELRHQYLIAFQASRKPGWHALVVRMRDKDLVVRARSGYNAGQSRPIS